MLRVPVCACACARVCMRACVRACVCVCVRVCVRTCVHGCGYVSAAYQQIDMASSCIPDPQPIMGVGDIGIARGQTISDSP